MSMVMVKLVKLTLGQPHISHHFLNDQQVISVTGELLHQRFFDYSYVTVPRRHRGMNHCGSDPLPLKKKRCFGALWIHRFGGFCESFFGVWSSRLHPFAKFDDAATTRAKWEQQWFKVSKKVKRIQTWERLRRWKFLAIIESQLVLTPTIESLGFFTWLGQRWVSMAW